MFPPRSTSRYLPKARAAHIARLVGAGVLVVVPAACGASDDAGVFAGVADTAPLDQPASSADTTTATTTPTSTLTSTTTPTTATTPATSAPATSAPTTNGTFPAGGEVAVDFTYAADASTGQVRNPYVAVWVEDAEGNYVTTIAVWYEQSGKGTRWLSDLRSWMSASNGDVSTSSTGATRSPGSYSVVWDGTDLDGNPVAQGDYVIFVEAAREHGPYEITSATITIGDSGTSVTLPDNGELSSLTATLAV